jgi:cytochrome c oxidase assembly protein subunit 15
MTDTAVSPWLHRWSMLTVCATFILLGLGSAVTTMKAGMADPVWPTKPTALFHFTAEQWRDPRLVIEHSHRLAGYIVGCCAIVLAAWLWLRESRRRLCWLGTAALLGVSVQGLFGGLRVTEDPNWGLEFRIIHGSFAPVVLSLLVSVAVLTSRAWVAPLSATADDAGRLRRASRFVLAAVYAQVVLGVLLRHSYEQGWNAGVQRGHLLVAFVATVGIVWLVRLAWVSGDRSLRRAGVALACVLGLQVALGVEVWMAQFSHFTLPELLPVTYPRIALRTAHVLGGALLLSATVGVALLARRDVASAAQPALTGARIGEAA